MSGSTGKGELIYGLVLTSISSCLFVGVLKFLGWVGGPMYHVCSSLGLRLFLIGSSSVPHWVLH